MSDHPSSWFPQNRIVVATRNRGKLREFRALLEPSGFEVICLSDLAILKDVDETGSTFAENARLKACCFSEETDLAVLADDSGLEVFALGGKPGIASARYAGPGASDGDRIYKLLSELELIQGGRQARFVCALALAQGGTILLETEGECRGEIVPEPHGANGFGYDPIFYFPQLGKTMAELTDDQKNTISHRARSVQSLLVKLGRPLSSKRQ
jgi:XTP/dITP diphosphohydrolase